MKTCPKCNQDYNDETLNYCLIDGSILSDETPTVIKSVPRSEKKLFNFKTFLIIFIVLAIPVTLFPPYSWGEERLLNESDRNTELFQGIKAKDVLPVKDFAFILAEDRQCFQDNLIATGKYRNCEDSFDFLSAEVLLQRKLIFGDWLLIYFLALIGAFLISIVFQKVILWRDSKHRL